MSSSSGNGTAGPWSIKLSKIHTLAFSTRDSSMSWVVRLDDPPPAGLPLPPVLYGKVEGITNEKGRECSTRFKYAKIEDGGATVVFSQGPF